ncbi:MAG: threonylcarbamoyl-AMP synthase [Planctomycetes bacterium]|nr:threonylcarbamoyl-AMP synthase [Planctomycetota bacterium]
MTCPIGTDIPHAASILRNGGLVAFATETVYGLGVNAFDVNAVARVFEVKNRPRFDPLIVHVNDPTWLERLATDVPDQARQLADRFWPGPLSLVLPKADDVPDLVTAGLSTVAVRIPDHPLALDLLRKADLPIAAPSANPFGCLSPTCAEHVAQQLGNRIDYILDGGICKVGIESTVLKVGNGEPVLLRPGGLSSEDIEAVIGPVTFAAISESETAKAQLSPGRLLKHYAPQTKLIIVPDLKDLTNPEEQSIGLLSLQPITERVSATACEVLSQTGDLREAAANFFAALRRLDAMDLDLIAAEPFPETGLGHALNDRLQRAAGD